MSPSKAAHHPHPVGAAPDGVVTLLRRWHKVECWVAVICFSFIAIVLATDVLGRELYGPVMRAFGRDVGATGLFGSQKLAVFALVIGSFAGVGIATAGGAHLVPRVGFGWVPRRFDAAMGRLSDVITGVFLLGVTWYGLVFVIASRESGVLAAVINVSAWPVQMAIPIGFLSAALRYFIFAIWPATKPVPPEFQE